ncbi:phage tail protein [Cupriavidus pampae]|uniref:Phage tail collar domain-containing protein n=1 Tax=Cupriavidus pampae TaxID=659251 RepID=A0ABN7ZQ99_9BURK|nr:tail fiber protein [Cupriavidus pampae]CAG9186460.1 hypothetical protein LMG32289_06439 [Cupriavidus pampae]
MAEPFLGELRLFAANYAPMGWALCDGSVMSIAQNEALFMLVGTTYGGDGITTFKLPDLRGRLPIGQGQGQNPVLTNRIMGQPIGTDTVTITPQQLPVHSHALYATTQTAASPTPAAGQMLATTPSAAPFYDNGQPVEASIGALAPVTIGRAGGSLPHENRMPTVSLNYIIATVGIFPSQS